jgi:hypothetical protein
MVGFADMTAAVLRSLAVVHHSVVAVVLCSAGADRPRRWAE